MIPASGQYQQQHQHNSPGHAHGMDLTRHVGIHNRHQLQQHQQQLNSINALLDEGNNTVRSPPVILGSNQQHFGNRAGHQFDPSETRFEVQAVKTAHPEKSQQPRTPLQLLNEISSKTGVVPEFTIAEDGPVHNRVYIATVKVQQDGDGMLWEGTGRGRTMQTAKQDAARNMLVSMDSRTELRLVEKPAEDVNMVGTIDPDPVPDGNPVSDLNELCSKTKNPAPLYKEESHTGLCHNIMYVMSCTVGRTQQTGKGPNKRLAKRAAAAAVLNVLLKEIEAELKEQASQDNSEKIGMGKLTEILQMKLTMGAGATTNGSPGSLTSSLEDVVKLFRDCSGRKMELLTRTPIQELKKCDPFQILNDICQEQNCIMEYMDFPPKSGETKSRCLVSCRMEPHPMFILSGIGDNALQARKKAVIDLLDTFRLVLREPSE